jgi:hypothetical protein
MPTNTPTLDAARERELTTGEVEKAMRELEAMNPGDGAILMFDRRYDGVRFHARIVWGSCMNRSVWHDTIEDALCAERAEIERCIAETVEG